MTYEALAWCGVVACTIMVVGVFSSIIGFTGMKKEPYSFRNHFISELGDPRFSKHKTLFAVTLVSSGAFEVPFAIGLGLEIGTVLAGIVAAIGVFSSVSCCLVGFFPEHKEKLHLAVASCFFAGMGFVMLFFAVAIGVTPTETFPYWVIAPTAAVLGFILLFIVDTLRLPKEELARTTRPWDWPDGRPQFWRNPFLEWCAFIAMAAWMWLVVLLAL